MIRTGTVIENPVTGERMVFRKTSRDTGGQAVVIETYVQPNGFVAAAHVHPSQEERFEIVRGTVGFKVGRKKLVVGPGGRVTVPAGTPHKFWNAGDSEAQFVCEVRPALQFESLLETMFALAVDGKTNGKGMPNLLRLAVIANHHFDTVRLPFPPAIVQRIGLALGRACRPPARLRANLCAGRSRARGSDGLAMRRRVFIALFFLGLCVLALVGAAFRLAQRIG
jgi:mannose-6-phosphate isomerase-like protein (cupin superfamily)